MTPIRKLLIANRGEIAVRVMRSARARGVRTVAVWSDADAGALHVRSADEAVRIGPPEAAQSYLNIDAIIAAAKLTGADAIHPGYGFLSERPAFAAACAVAGLVFVGPPASAIAAMGDKAEAKRRMIAVGVPTIPGYQDEDQAEATLLQAARHIGFPVMVKASAGGGGRGQRIVFADGELPDAIASARREAESAFGDRRLIIEKAVIGARHVEIQIIGDQRGAIVHLGERDCSLQRRRQKVIEEAPSPALSPEKRAAMGKAAVEAARAVGYVNAGTVEFLFDPATEDFFFLEMNTRLQVEHPVTECVTGLDLVDLQLDIAEGRPLPFAQDDIRLDGWAMEARLYAEDPAQGFLPQAGRIGRWRAPQAVRLDAGVEEGDVVTTYYDPMIAKVIAAGRTREEARRKLAAALQEMAIIGVGNNREFLLALLEDAAFVAGEAATDYIERHLDRLAKRRPPAGAAEAACLAAILVEAPFGGLLSNWSSRGDAGFPLHLERLDGSMLQAAIALDGWRVTARLPPAGDADERLETIFVRQKDNRTLVYEHQGRLCRADFVRHDAEVEVADAFGWARYRDVTRAPAAENMTGADVVNAPMAGIVTSIAVAPGDVVEKGRVLATIEAMKMEHALKAPRAGIVASIGAKIGQQVPIRALIVALQTV